MPPEERRKSLAASLLGKSFYCFRRISFDYNKHHWLRLKGESMLGFPSHWMKQVDEKEGEEDNHHNDDDKMTSTRKKEEELLSSESICRSFSKDKEPYRKRSPSLSEKDKETYRKRSTSFSESFGQQKKEPSEDVVNLLMITKIDSNEKGGRLVITADEVAQSIIGDEKEWKEFQQQIKNAKVVTSLGVSQFCASYFQSKAVDMERSRKVEAAAEAAAKEEEESKKSTESNLSKLRRRLSIL